MPSRWQWTTRTARRDASKPLGASDPSAHLDGAPSYDGARPRPITARRPSTPAGMLDDAGIGYDGRRAPSRPAGTDVTVAEHYGLQAGDRTQPAGQSSMPAHLVDQGDGPARLLRPAKNVDGVTKTTELRQVDPELPAGSRTAPFRGANALVENNPDGYRYGVKIYRWVERRMYKPRIVHTERPAVVRTAPGPHASAPLAGATRTSPAPFATRARQRTFAAAPLVRRLPEAIDYATTPGDPEPVYDGFWRLS